MNLFKSKTKNVVLSLVAVSIIGTAQAVTGGPDAVVHPDLQVPPPANSQEAIDMIQRALQGLEEPQLVRLDARVPDYKPTYRILETSATYAIVQYLLKLAKIQEEVSQYFSRLYELKRQGETSDAFKRALQHETERSLEVQVKANILYQSALNELYAAYGQALTLTQTSAEQTCQRQSQNRCTPVPAMYNVNLGAALRCETFVCASQILLDQSDWYRFVENLNQDISIGGTDSKEPASLGPNQTIDSSLVLASSIHALSAAVKMNVGNKTILALASRAGQAKGMIRSDAILTVLNESVDRWKNFKSHYLANVNVEITLSKVDRPKWSLPLEETIQDAFDNQLKTLPSADFDSSDDEATRTRLNAEVDNLLRSLETVLFPTQGGSQNPYQFAERTQLIQNLVAFGSVKKWDPVSNQYQAIRMEDDKISFCRQQGFDGYYYIGTTWSDRKRNQKFVPGESQIFCQTGLEKKFQVKGRTWIKGDNLVIEAPYLELEGELNLPLSFEDQAMHDFACRKMGYKKGSATSGYSEESYVISFNNGNVIAYFQKKYPVSELTCSTKELSQ